MFCAAISDASANQCWLPPQGLRNGGADYLFSKLNIHPPNIFSISLNSSTIIHFWSNERQSWQEMSLKVNTVRYGTSPSGHKCLSNLTTDKLLNSNQMLWPYTFIERPQHWVLRVVYSVTRSVSSWTSCLNFFWSCSLFVARRILGSTLSRVTTP